MKPQPICIILCQLGILNSDIVQPVSSGHLLFYIVDPLLDVRVSAEQPLCVKCLTLQSGGWRVQRHVATRYFCFSLRTLEGSGTISRAVSPPGL